MTNNKKVEEYKRTVSKWSINQLFTALQLLICDKPDAIAMLEEIYDRTESVHIPSEQDKKEKSIPSEQDSKEASK